MNKLFYRIARREVNKYKRIRHLKRNRRAFLQWCKTQKQGVDEKLLQESYSATEWSETILNDCLEKAIKKALYYRIRFNEKVL